MKETKESFEMGVIKLDPLNGFQRTELNIEHAVKSGFEVAQILPFAYMPGPAPGSTVISHILVIARRSK